MGVDGTLTRLRAMDARRPWVLDSALALLLLLGAILTTSAPSHISRPPDATMYALAFLAAAPFVLRRRAPLAVLLITSAPVMALIVLGYSTALVGAGLFLAAYTVAAWSTMRATLIAAGYVLAILVSLTVLVPWEMGPAELITNGAVFAGALGLGRGTLTRRTNLVLLAERAELAERARVEEARRAVSDERLRIAQELHDVVGHTLGVIALQAGVGAHVIDADPAEAKASLLSVQATSRSALTEIRRILGALRSDESDPNYQAPPGIEALDRLAADLTEAGLPVEIRTEGEPAVLPSALDLTAYRVVQESLTNVVKHAGPGARAAVTVRHEPAAIVLTVEDDGTGVKRHGQAPVGHGHLGMRERVAVWGGTLTTGPLPDGGYRVTARLPYGERDS